MAVSYGAGYFGQTASVELYKKKYKKFKLINTFSLGNASFPLFLFVSDYGFVVTIGDFDSEGHFMVMYDRNGKVIKNLDLNEIFTENQLKEISVSYGLNEHWFCRSCLFEGKFHFEKDGFVFFDHFKRRVYVSVVDGCVTIE